MYSGRKKDTSLAAGKLWGRIVVPLSFIYGKDQVASLDGWFSIQLPGSFKTAEYLRGKEFRDAVAADEHNATKLIQKQLRDVNMQLEKHKKKKKAGRLGSLRLKVEFKRTKKL